MVLLYLYEALMTCVVLPALIAVYLGFEALFRRVVRRSSK